MGEQMTQYFPPSGLLRYLTYSNVLKWKPTMLFKLLQISQGEPEVFVSLEYK